MDAASNGWLSGKDSRQFHADALRQVAKQSVMGIVLLSPKFVMTGGVPGDVGAAAILGNVGPDSLAMSRNAVKSDVRTTATGAQARGELHDLGVFRFPA